MFISVFLACVLAATSTALPGGFGGGGYGGGGGGYGGGGGGYGGGGGGGYGASYNVPTPYSYSYGVAAGNTNFGQWENGDGHGNVRGKYYVHLPDGRIQKVNYWADGSGYHPIVTYLGKAKYPASYGYGGGHGYGR